MDEKLIAKLKKEAGLLFEDVVKLRREIHMHPELGMEEVVTASKVAKILEENGLKVRKNVANTGLVATLEGAKSGKVIALRADMDALPLEDQKNTEYASKIAGKMHACGHDAHTAILCGTACLLSKFRSELAGTVKFLFQPAEEGPGGAELMIAEGALKNPDVDAAFGLHVATVLPVGKVSGGVGPASANTDEIRVTLIGKGGHAAAPHTAIDPVCMAAQTIVTLQQIVSRMLKPQKAAVLTFGQINGGTKNNIIAEKVELGGTLRTLDDDIKEQALKAIEQVVKGVSSALGGDYQIKHYPGYVGIINDQKMNDILKAVSLEFLGEDSFELEEYPSMGGEDFAYISRAVPSCFFRLGAKGGESSSYPGHHPLFDIDEQALRIGMELFSGIVFSYLGAKEDGDN